MKTAIKFELSIFVLLFLFLVPFTILSQNAEAALIDVNIYSGFSDSGGGAPYSNLVGSFTSSDIAFATNTGYSWHPFGLSSFGADMTGFLEVTTTGTYGFTLNSDDGSLLFIDGSLVVDNGGGHGPTAVTGSINLSAGIHPFEVQFFEDFGGPSGVDLSLPSGVNYEGQQVPEPSTMLLLSMGIAGLGLLRRRFKN